jgi:hypothetical protein
MWKTNEGNNQNHASRHLLPLMSGNPTLPVRKWTIFVPKVDTFWLVYLINYIVYNTLNMRHYIRSHISQMSPS